MRTQVGGDTPPWRAVRSHPQVVVRGLGADRQEQVLERTLDQIEGRVQLLEEALRDGDGHDAGRDVPPQADAVLG